VVADRKWLRSSDFVDGRGQGALVEAGRVEFLHLAGDHVRGGRVAGTPSERPRASPPPAATDRSPVAAADDHDDDDCAEGDGDADGGDDGHRGHGLDRRHQSNSRWWTWSGRDSRRRSDDLEKAVVAARLRRPAGFVDHHNAEEARSTTRKNSTPPRLERQKSAS